MEKDSQINFKIKSNFKRRGKKHIHITAIRTEKRASATNMKKLLNAVMTNEWQKCHSRKLSETEQKTGIDDSLKILKKSSRIMIQKGTRPRLYYEFNPSFFFFLRNRKCHEI